MSEGKTFSSKETALEVLSVIADQGAFSFSERSRSLILEGDGSLHRLAVLAYKTLGRSEADYEFQTVDAPRGSQMATLGTLLVLRNASGLVDELVQSGVNKASLKMNRLVEAAYGR